MAKAKPITKVVDITMNQGDDYYFQITVRDSKGNPIDITGYEFKCKAKNSAEDTAVMFSATATITDAKGGQVLFHFKDEDTKNIDTDGDNYSIYSEFTYDALMKTPDGDVTRLVNGTIFVSPGVSWAEG